jgi:hypothetical protein
LYCDICTDRETITVSRREGWRDQLPYTPEALRDLGLDGSGTPAAVG